MHGPRVVTTLGCYSGAGLEIPPSSALETTRDCPTGSMSIRRVSLPSPPACFLDLKIIPPFDPSWVLLQASLHPFPSRPSGP